MKFNNNFVYRVINNKGILINIKESSEVYVFENVAKDFYEKIHNNIINSDIEEMSYKYNISKEEVINDINNFINNLKELGIIYE